MRNMASEVETEVNKLLLHHKNEAVLPLDKG